MSDHLADLVSEEVERLAADLDIDVYVALRAPAGLRIVGVFTTSEEAKEACARNCAKHSHEEPVWTVTQTGNLRSQKYNANWKNGAGPTCYFIAKSTLRK